MDFVCLMYHQVSREPTSRADPQVVSVNCFRAQMNWLAQRGYAGVSVGQALATAGRPADPRRGRRQIALSFDDGYQDFLTTAWPVLEEWGFGATLFVVSGRAGKSADWTGATGAPLLAWHEIRELSARGVEIGAHGHTHRALDELPLAAAREELLIDRQRLAEELDQVPDGLAYPYGRWTPAIAQAAQQAGYLWAATARGGVNHHQTPRFGLRRTKVSGRDCDMTGRLRYAVKVRTGYARLLEWRMDLRHVS